MEPSEEIRRVVNRWITALTKSDAEAVLGRMSEHPGALSIGSAPDEWWHGTEAIAVWRRQIEEFGGFPLEWDEIEAWEEGDVGWAGAQVVVAMPEQRYQGRMTVVLHLERGEWKVVQTHVSVAVSNEDVFGTTLTVSLEQLEAEIQRERPDLSGTLAADGTVTIVFTDIVDSTVLNARLGDHVWLDVLRRHNAVIEAAAKNHGGDVVKTLGDGSMLAFSSARRAVACTREIQVGIGAAFADASPPIRVRIGIHTGEAVREADDFFGTTVNYAARVASNALGGEVLVSDLVHALVEGDDTGPTFRESRDVELKGLEGTHRLFALDLE